MIKCDCLSQIMITIYIWVWHSVGHYWGDDPFSQLCDRLHLFRSCLISPALTVMWTAIMRHSSTAQFTSAWSLRAAFRDFPIVTNRYATNCSLKPKTSMARNIVSPTDIAAEMDWPHSMLPVTIQAVSVTTFKAMWFGCHFSVNIYKSLHRIFSARIIAPKYQSFIWGWLLCPVPVVILYVTHWSLSIN